MHILLTDQLVCPRCGPNFGLIVLAERVEDRDVLEGALGCANCRSTYAIRSGVADLRIAGDNGLLASAPVQPDPDRALRLAALLGVTQPNATVMVIDRAGDVAAGLADTVPAIHVVGATTALPGELVPGAGILSRIVTGSSLPVRSGSLRGLAIVGMDAGSLLPEAGRSLAPGARIVVEGADGEFAAELVRNGFELHLEQDGVVVASPSDRS